MSIQFLEKDLNSIFLPLSGVITRAPTAWLRVSGPDAAAFLQGQCTQELRGLKPGQVVFALWLSIKGRVLGESWVLREAASPGGEEAWLLWSAHTTGEALRARLEEFIIADDVTVTDLGASGDWEQVTLAGEAAEGHLRMALGDAEPPGAGKWAPIAGGYLFAGRRGQPQTWDWVRPVGGMALTGLKALGDEDLLRSRLVAGVPAIPAEFGPADLPQEAGLETMAVSFTKGCYLGQEVMARLHAMGQVRRKLLRVAGTGAVPTAGTPFYHAADETKRAGELRAAVDDGRGGWIGLAMINLLGLDPAKALRLEGGGVSAILQGGVFGVS